MRAALLRGRRQLSERTALISRFVELYFEEEALRSELQLLSHSLSWPLEPNPARTVAKLLVFTYIFSVSAAADFISDRIAPTRKILPDLSALNGLGVLNLTLVCVLGLITCRLLCSYTNEQLGEAIRVWNEQLSQLREHRARYIAVAVPRLRPENGFARLNPMQQPAVVAADAEAGAGAGANNELTLGTAAPATAIGLGGIFLPRAQRVEAMAGAGAIASSSAWASSVEADFGERPEV